MNSSLRKTKNLTEAAAAAAISALLVLLKLLAPFLVFITMLTSAIPIAIICRLHGMKWGIGASVAEIFLVTVIGGIELGITTAFYAAALGLAMGYGFYHNLSFNKTMHLTALAYIVEMSYKIAVSIYLLGISDALSAGLDRLIAVIRWIWKPLASLFSFDPDPGKAMFTTSGMIMLAIIFILNAYSYAYLNQEIGRDILKRLLAGRR